MIIKIMPSFYQPFVLLFIMFATFCLLSIGQSQSLTCKKYLLYLDSLYINQHDKFKSQIFPYLLYSGKGIDDLGYPQSCLNDSSNAYTTVQLQFTPNKTTFTAYMGLCFTNLCSVDDLNLGAHFLIDYILEDYQIPIESHFIEPELNLQFSGLALAFGLVFGLFFIIGMLGLIKNWIIMCMTDDEDEEYAIQSSYMNLDHPSSSDFDADRELSIQPILLRISMRDKWKRLWVDEKSTKIYSFSLFRIISIPLIIYGQLFFESNKAAFNYTSFDNAIYRDFFAKAAMFSYYIPDVFFIISGFLFCKKMLLCDEDGANPYLEIFKNILARIARLYPVYLTVFLIYWCITPALHCGPVWFVYKEQVAICDNSWWKVLLMIDNWFSESCYPMLWFVQVEVQCVIFTSIFFMIFFTHRVASYLYLGLAMIASTFLIFFFSADLPVKLEIVLSEYSSLYYRSFYSHIFFYLWGVMLALLANITSFRINLEEQIFKDTSKTVLISLISSGIILLVILCPSVWISTEISLSLELTLCRFGILIAFTLIFLNGMFKQNREEHFTVIHHYGYYIYPVIMCSQFIMQSSFWSVSSFFYVDAINLINNSLPIILVSLITGIVIGLMMDVRGLIISK